MSVQRCGTCRHWIPPTERTDFRNLYKGNEADRLFGICGLIDLADAYEEAPDPVPLAATKDGSDYRATLHTQEAFGCVLHEERK